MKIEKLNENQIRCTLTHADLAARHLKLSELAYGTEKAKSLFRDMMQQASFDFGFEAENIPLMIEAIPSSADSIVLNLIPGSQNSPRAANPMLKAPKHWRNWLVQKNLWIC